MDQNNPPSQHSEEFSPRSLFDLAFHPREGQAFWSRCNGGWIAGVCQSMAPKIGTTPEIMRIVWVVLMLISFGGAVIFYLACAVSFPNIDEPESLEESLNKKALGVCLRLSRALRLEVGLVRTLMVMLLVGSLGVTALLYVILHFVMPENPEPWR